MIFRRAIIPLLIAISAIPLVSCGQKLRPVLFQTRGASQALFGLSREAAEGTLNFSRPVKLEYCFSAPPTVFSPAAFEIAYSLNTAADTGTGGLKPVLEIEGNIWALPLPSAFPGEGGTDGANTGTIFHYAIPISGAFPGRFSIMLAAGESGTEKKTAGKDVLPLLRIHSVEIKERWFGFYHRLEDGNNHRYASPFVFKRDDSWVIDLSAVQAVVPSGIPARDGLLPRLTAELLPKRESASVAAVLDTGNRRFEALPYMERFNIPAGMTPNEGQLTLSGNHAISFYLDYGAIPPFPEPVATDPGMVLAWPAEHWRDRRYEVFRWDRFPSLLILDTANYAIQDRLLKRLAFFVEKAGFRGRLAPDSEIAGLHGWNAHDYRSGDLAHFFQTARETQFPLLAEERELEKILLNAGIIRESGGRIQAGEGGIISISRESPDYLRFRFMAHEGFHGLFFIDEDFRTFSRYRWQQLPAEAKRFIVSFFDYQRYDTADEYLLINEFMAHVLQQPVSQAGRYFGETLPSRIETISWRQADLPEKDQRSGTWPALALAFTREAQAFSEYAGSRWGLAAGRVSLVTVRETGLPQSPGLLRSPGLFQSP